MASIRFIVPSHRIKFARKTRSKSAALHLRAMASMNRTNAGSSDGLTYSGLSECSIHFSDLRIIPGAATGPTSGGMTHPAFPCDAPLPTVAASRTVTSWPAEARR